MLKVAVVADPYGYRTKDALVTFLAGQECKVVDLGVNSPDEEYEIQELASRVATAFQGGVCQCCIGLSLTGNSLQIWANKYDFIRAAPCLSVDAANDAIALNANMCDITSRLPLKDVIALVEIFLGGLRQKVIHVQ